MSKVFVLLMLIALAGCGSPMPTAGVDDPNIQLAVAAAQLTGTAQSVEWTATAQVSGWTATAQSWTPTPSLTPVPTSTPSITPTPTVNATGTMIVERMQAEIAELNREAERKELTNTFWAVLTPILAVVALALIVLGIAYAAITISRAKDIQVIERGEGDAPLLVSRGRRQVIDMDANPNYRAGFDESLMRQAFLHWLKEQFGVEPAMPQITAERQDTVKGRDQMIDMNSRTKVSTAAVKKLLEGQGLDKALPMPTAITAPVVTEDDNNMPLPPWEFIKQWDGRTSKPLGFGRKGLITAKAASPHILISGKTGSGKTIYMMRTLTVASLAKGSQVVNIGYSSAGYGVFERHVNFHNVQLPDPRYVIECLAQVYDELKERKVLIGGDMVEWEYWPGGQPPRPFLDVHIDELGNMAEDILKDYDNGSALTKELWSTLSRIANEGRKVGIRFTAALQDPTAKSIDLRFRRNCTLVAFQQGDMDQSRAFMGTAGAEKLSTGHFMAVLDSLVLGGGFSPTDAEIMDYLAKSPVQAVEKPKWIEGVTRPVDGNQFSVMEEPVHFIQPTPDEPLPVKPVDEIAEMAERIRSQWSQDMSVRHVAIKLLGFPQNGGAYGTKAEKVIAYLTATTKPATTTEKKPEMGSFAPEMA